MGFRFPNRLHHTCFAFSLWGLLAAEAAPPDIVDSELYMIHYWSGVYGGDNGGGFGRVDAISVEETRLSFSTNTFSASGTDLGVDRDVSDEEVDLSVDSDKDTRFDNVLGVTAPESSPSDSGNFTVSAYGRVDLGGGVYGYTGPTANTAVRHDRETAFQSENLAIGFGVRIPSGVTQEDLSGEFVVVTMEHGVAGGPNPPDHWGNNEFINVTTSQFTLDGSGGFSENFLTTGFSRTLVETLEDLGDGGDADTRSRTMVSTSESSPDSGTDLGTYHVSDSGLLTLNYGDGDVIQAQVGADGHTAVLGVHDFSDNSHGVVAFGFGVRKGSSMTNGDVVGTYTLIDLEHLWSGAVAGMWGEVDYRELGRTYVTLGANGTLDLRRDQWEIVRVRTNEDVDNNPSEPGDIDRVLKNKFNTEASSTSYLLGSGTYSLDASGAITVQLRVAGERITLPGQVSADGNTLLFGGTEFDGPGKSASAFIGIGIRRTLPATSALGSKIRAGSDGPQDDGFHFTIQADAGLDVEVLFSETLGGWQLLQFLTPTSPESSVIDPDGSGGGRRFYAPVLAPW